MLKDQVTDYASAQAFLRSHHGLGRWDTRVTAQRTRALLAAAGNPQQKYQKIVITGSSGKGSTTAFLRRILEAGGGEVGSTTKPSLITPREYMMHREQPITEERYAQLVRDHADLITGIDKFPGCSRVTMREIQSWLAVQYFADIGVDYAVVEGNVGVRTDMVGALDPDYAVITNISLDHVETLGGTLTAIAENKGAAMRPGRPAVTAAEGEGLQRLRYDAEAIGCPLWVLGREIRIENVAVFPEGCTFDLCTPAGSITGLRTSLAGEHQAKNAALAAALAQQIAIEDPRITTEAIRTGLSTAWLPGRGQKVRERPDVIVSAGHTHFKAGASCEYLRQIKDRYRRVVAITAFERNYVDVLDNVLSIADEVIVTRSKGYEQDADPAAVERCTQSGIPVRSFRSYQDALDTALEEAAEEDLIVVVGTFYLVGGVLRALGVDYQNPYLT